MYQALANGAVLPDVQYRNAPEDPQGQTKGHANTRAHAQSLTAHITNQFYTLLALTLPMVLFFFLLCVFHLIKGKFLNNSPEFNLNFIYL